MGSTNLIENVELLGEAGAPGLLLGRKAGGRFAAQVGASRRPSGGRFAISVRPETVNIAGAGPVEEPGGEGRPNRLVGVIRARTCLGPAIRYRVAVADGVEVLADQPNREGVPWEVGGPVVWWEPPDALVVAER